MNKFPGVCLAFYYSGVVLYWIERHHPELFMLLEDLLSRKQVEFLGGGFYDPILPLLPMADKIGQIEMLTTYLRKHFGKRPQGCWLPAMAWEQSLVGPLSSSGMGFTFLEDQQFAGAGQKPGKGGIFSPCITEAQGKLITVFPTAEAMGKQIQKRELTLAQLLESLPNNSENNILTLPITPALHNEDFFLELSGAESMIDFTLPSKAIKNLRGLKKVYFPELWSEERSLGNGVHPRQFLADHPEADGIYTKMIYVNTLINNQLRGDKTRKRTALEELWKAQDSGIFRIGREASPGLFSSPVRKAAYSSLIEAEKITREKGKFTPSLSVFDFDLDGEGEYIFQDEKLNCYLKSRGAGIFELDYIPAAWNYLDTLHGEGRRCSFADWIAPAGTVPQSAGPGGIGGGRFCGSEDYEVSEIERLRRRVSFRLPAKENLPWGSIETVKTWQIKKSSLALEYVLRNTGSKSESFIFSTRLDLSFSGTGDDSLRIFSLKEGEKESIVLNGTVTVKDIRVLEFQDIKNETIITLESSRSYDGQIFHVFSGVSGFEEYQSTCTMPFFPVSLEGGKTWKVSFLLKISS